MDQTLSTQHKPEMPWRMIGLLTLGVIAWLAAYNIIQPLANWIAYSLLAQPQGSHLGDALAFFFYDVPKIILLLGGMIFLISLLRTFFSAEQTRAWLGGKREAWATCWRPCSGSSRRSVRARRCRSLSVLSNWVFRWV